MQAAQKVHISHDMRKLIPSESIVNGQTDVSSLVNGALRFQTYCLLQYFYSLPKIEFLHFFSAKCLYIQVTK